MAQVKARCLTRWRLPATVRSVVAKDTVSTMVKLAREINESVSDGAGKGMVSHLMASSRDSAERRCQGHGVSHGEASRGRLTSRRQMVQVMARCPTRWRFLAQTVCSFYCRAVLV